MHRGLVDAEFEHIVLIATPSFLGHLRAALSDPVRRAVLHEMAKDVTGLDLDSIRDYFH